MARRLRRCRRWETNRASTPAGGQILGDQFYRPQVGQEHPRLFALSCHPSEAHRQLCSIRLDFLLNTNAVPVELVKLAQAQARTQKEGEQSPVPQAVDALEKGF